MTAPALERPATVADNSPPDRLLTRAEVARLLAVSERTVLRLDAAGKLTRVTVGRRGVRYRESEVRDAIARGEV